MGKKRVSVQKAKCGSDVVDHPPCDKFPEGHQVMVPTRSLADRMSGKQQEMADGSNEKLEVRKKAISDQRQKLSSYPAVPNDKRVV